MILLVDVGNTRIKWANLTAEGKVENHHAFSYQLNKLFDQLQEQWEALLPIDEIIVANVGGWEVKEVINDWAQENGELNPEYFTSPAAFTGLQNGYPQHETLGIDRWFSMVAAWHQWEESFFIIDCGSAITVDAVNASGQHLGGLIIPGMQTMQKSLINNMPGCDVRGEKSKKLPHLLATNTAHAISGGAYYTIAAVIDRVTQDLVEFLGTRAQRIMTGGDAEAVIPLLQYDYHYMPNLVLEGMAVTINSNNEITNDSDPDDKE